jgi:serine/threonine-protein kinase
MGKFMRTLLLAAAGVLLLAGPSFAKDAKPPSCTAQWTAKSDTDKAATTRKAFMAGCKESNAAPAMAPATTAMAPAMGTKPLSCTAQWNAKSDADKAGTTRKAFMAGCKGGDTAAAAGAAPAATAAMVPAKGAKPPSCTSQWNGKSDTDKAATTRKAFMAGCKEMNAGTAAVAPAATMAPAKPAMVPTSAPMKPAMAPAVVKPTTTMAPVTPPTMKASGAPAAVAPTGAAPEGATGVCKDGTYTKSKGHSGACSHHGGVAKWL